MSSKIDKKSLRIVLSDSDSDSEVKSKTTEKGSSQKDQSNTSQQASSSKTNSSMRPKSAIKSENNEKKDKKNFILISSEDEDDFNKLQVNKKNQIQHNNKNSRSSSGTPSTERYKADVNLDKKQMLEIMSKSSNKKIAHFSRPRNKKASSDDSDEDDKKSLDTLMSESKIKTKKSVAHSNSTSPSFSETAHVAFSNTESRLSNNTNQQSKNKKSNFMKNSSDSDSELESNKKNKITISSTQKSSIKESDKTNKKNKKKSILLSDSSKSDSSVSTSRSRSRSRTGSSTERNKYDDYDDQVLSNSMAPIRVKIERKPPIDKSNWNKKHHRSTSSLEKPNEDDSNSDSDSKSKESGKNTHKLNETFDMNDSNSSSNEMTDVSPLPTPHKTSKSSKKKEKSKHKSDDKTTKDVDRLDMSEFYKAFNNDHELNKKIDSVLNNYPKLNKSSIYNSNPYNSRQMSAASNEFSTSFDLGGSTQFTNKLMRLDADNRRLIKKMLNSNQNAVESKKYIDISKPIRITSSALNRQRDQQRIERENQLILKRLLKVQPSKNIKKDEQLKDYERNFGVASLNYSSKIAPRTMSASSQNSTFLNSNTSIGFHNNSGISTKRSMKSSANNSRISSAKSTSKGQFSFGNLDPSEILKRAASASRSRPEWSDRW